MMMEFSYSVAMPRPSGVIVPHALRLFQDTETLRRQIDGRWLARCWKLLRNFGGRKTTDPRN
jgi:hypothetical protein